MFYYRIVTTTTTEKGGEQTTRRKAEYREFLRAADLGDHVTAIAVKRPQMRSITIHPVNQRTYIQHTRAAE